MRKNANALAWGIINNQDLISLTVQGRIRESRGWGRGAIFSLPIHCTISHFWFIHLFSMYILSC